MKYVKGHVETQEIKLKRINSLEKAWINRKDYIKDIKEKRNLIENETDLSIDIIKVSQN